MNAYEQLQEEAYQNGVTVIDFNFDSKNIKGLYYDNTIAINKNINTINEKACVLAEELGHHYTTVGNILSQNSISDCKQELRARLWAYNDRIGLLGIINCFENQCRNIYDMADLLEVPETFINEALKCYRQKYGIFTTLDNYIIYFEPCLTVMRIG